MLNPQAGAQLPSVAWKWDYWSIWRFFTLWCLIQRVDTWKGFFFNYYFIFLVTSNRKVLVILQSSDNFSITALTSHSHFWEKFYTLGPCYALNNAQTCISNMKWTMYSWLFTCQALTVVCEVVYKLVIVNFPDIWRVRKKLCNSVFKMTVFFFAHLAMKGQRQVTN